MAWTLPSALENTSIRPGTRARTRPSYTAQSGMCRASHTAMTPRAFSTLNSPGMVSRNSRS